MTEALPVTRADIEAAHARIAAHVRRTPVIAPGRGAFGLDLDLILKLECLQHMGSFKSRGAYVRMSRLPASACSAFRERTGAIDIHPYDAVPTIAGQGTTGLEWEEQSPELDTVLVAVGGGGLIAGVATWYENRVKVVAVEPETSCCLKAARDAGQPVDVDVEGVAADSLGARRIGTLPFRQTEAFVDAALVVPDAAIVAAQALLWRDLNVATEPGGATALAALLSGAYQPTPGERVGVLACGSNVDIATLAALPA